MVENDIMLSGNLSTLRAAASLNLEESWFCNFVAARPDVFLLIDGSPNIVFARTAAASCYGYEPGEMKGLV